jgi:hypothetical protein
VIQRLSDAMQVCSPSALVAEVTLSRRSTDRYSPLGTRFSAFFTVPRSIMIFSCSSVIA